MILWLYEWLKQEKKMSNNPDNNLESILFEFCIYKQSQLTEYTVTPSIPQLSFCNFLSLEIEYF